MDALTQHPALAAIVGGILVAYGVVWVSSNRLRKELREIIHEEMAPVIADRINEHNRDEDAHEAAGIKVRKERNEMFNDLRDRMEEQHNTLLVAITEIRTNQTTMQATLTKVDSNLTRLKAEHDRIVSNEQLRSKRYGDLNGTDFAAVRHNPDCPRRRTDGEEEDHRGERK